CSGVVGAMTSLLDISGALRNVQSEMMSSAKTMFLSFIGGKHGTIAQYSGAGLLFLLSAIYLFYQFSNGKGNFLKSLFHLLAVVSTMFFFFGNFSYTAEGGKHKTAMGGQILFDTVSNTSNKVKAGITSGLAGIKHPEQSGNFLVDYVVLPTANLVNTGNPTGKMQNGEKFDYEKASGKKGEKYVDQLAKDGSPYLKNDGAYIGYQMAAVFLGHANLWLYAVPLIAMNLTISGLSLLLCVFIVILPFAAILSFIPFLRNSFFGVLKHSLGLLVAPAILGASLGFLFYIMTQVDLVVLNMILGKPQSSLLAGIQLLNGFEFLIFIPVVSLIKIVFMVILWKSRTSIARTVTGESNGSDVLNDMKREARDAKEKVEGVSEGASEVAAGVATENPAMVLDGAQKMSSEHQEEEATQENRHVEEESETGELLDETEDILASDDEPEDNIPFDEDIDFMPEDDETESLGDTPLNDEDTISLDEDDISLETLEEETQEKDEGNQDETGDENQDITQEEFQDSTFVEDEEAEVSERREIDVQENISWDDAASDLDALRE
ncbi:MAG: hypothetical protein ACRCSC_05880, partial [Lactococcus garvieae]